MLKKLCICLKNAEWYCAKRNYVFKDGGKMKKLLLLLKFMKGYRLLYAGSIISIGLATLISVIIPLVIRTTIDSVIGDKPMELPGWIVAYINAYGGRKALLDNMWVCGLVLVVLTILSGVFLYLKGKWSAVASESIARNIREKLFAHLQRLTYDEHVKAKTGDLIQRCTSDVDTVRRFLAVQFVEIGRAIFMVAMVCTIMFSLDVKLALVSMIIIPFIFIFAVVFFIKMQRVFQKFDEAEGKVTTVLQENLTGVRVVRAFARQSYEVNKFEEKNLEFRNHGFKMMRLFALYWSSSDFLCLIQIGAVLVLGSYWAVLGKISIGTLMVFTTYVGMLLWPIRQMGQILTDMGKTFVSIGRIQEILDKPGEVMDEDGLKPDIKGEIEFSNVSFAYGEGDILSNVSFRVKKGQTVSIMGPTGSGKTTLINLLLRLYDYDSGSIKIDGVELKRINKEWLRRNVGMVAQEPFLYSKTIKENIGFACTKPKDNEIFEAASIAAVHNVIQDFEKGYDTLVGERGVTLSGGQKQRVTIARTVIKDYPVLIFDDSLSAVDTETDAQIRKSLRERSRDVTTFIISHRITTLSESDLILVLDKGRLVQMGTHDELMLQEGLYKRVWDIQNSLEDDLEYEMADSESA
jgi:ABC-type multidrug transport system, ATPase and permease components